MFLVVDPIGSPLLLLRSERAIQKILLIYAWLSIAGLSKIVIVFIPIKRTPLYSVFSVPLKEKRLQLILSRHSCSPSKLAINPIS